MADNNESVKISKFSFWLITSIALLLMTGFGTWISSTHNKLSQTQVEMAKISSDMSHIKEKIDQNFKLLDEFNIMRSELSVLKAQVEISRRELEAARGQRFNMPDYDKYVKPIQDDLMQRVSKLEARADNE